MRSIVDRIVKYYRSPRSLARCRFNYYVSSFVLVITAMYLYNEFKTSFVFLSSVYFETIYLQLFYGAVCASCGVLLGRSKTSIKFVSVANLFMLYFPLVYFLLVQKNIRHGGIDFFKYELGLSLIFLYTINDLISYRKTVMGSK